jgi:hypothetical protein
LDPKAPRKVILSNLPVTFGEGSLKPLDPCASHSPVLQKLSDTLFTALELDRNRSQAHHLLENLIHKNLIRAITKIYPVEFVPDYLSAMSLRDRATHILKSIKSLISPLELPPDHQSILQKSIILNFMDDMGLVGDGLRLRLTKSFAITMSNIAISMLERPRSIMSTMADSDPPIANLRSIMAAMEYLQGATPDIVKVVIARARNPVLLPFRTDRRIVSVLFGSAALSEQKPGAAERSGLGLRR